jgi:2-polyprenyl-6-methoxyphenol hydroxylase-like FAD-dependent oxidoreductase
MSSEQREHRPERIAIAGAGIGGLCLAIALRRHGFAPVVHEDAPAIRPVGAGIWVPSNALRALDGLGLAGAVEAAGVPLERARLSSTRRGVLQDISFAAVRERYGHGNVAIHRAELHRVLLEALPPGTVRLSERVEGLSETDREVVLELAGGGSASADLVVGADGIASSVRRHVAPAARLRDSGQCCYRGVARLDLPERFRREGCEIWGGPVRFGYSEIGNGLVYWFAPWTTAAIDDVDGPGAAPPEQAERTLAGLRRRYRDFPEPVAAILEATEAGSVLRTDLRDLAPLERWWRGRAVLLGDAAHATTPNLGQGGAQAIEDAVALADALAELPSLAEPAAAFARYQAGRERVANRVVARSRALGRIAHWTRPWACALRDRALRAIPERLAVGQLAWLNESPRSSGR